MNTSLLTNKHAYYNLNILEIFEAGIKLSGAEVKALKNKQANLKGSFVRFIKSEPWLVNAYIALYKPAGKQTGYDPERPRKLLLSKKEIKYIEGKLTQKGLTIVPLKVYTKRSFLKITIGLATGKRKYDKRQVIKEREMARRLRKLTKEQYQS